MSNATHSSKIDLANLKTGTRLLVEVQLKVAPGTNGRFQPTGFPDLGPALYRGIREFEEVDGKGTLTKIQRPVNMLFSDTAAALGNWLEEACLSGDDYNTDCQGIPYVRVLDGDSVERPFLTSSVREPHRLASPYVLNAKRDTQQETLKDWLRKPEQLAVNKQRPVRAWILAQKLFSVDPGCILHGVFLEELDGRLRLPRLLSGFIEAANPNQVNYGGVYRGEVTAKDNIPFPKQEFTSDDIQASFIVHLSTLHGYKLTDDQDRFLILWALYKIDELLRGSLRLRSGCEFIKTVIIPTIDGAAWPWPSSADIKADFQAAKAKCFPEMANETDNWKKRRVTVVAWQETIKPTAVRLTEGLSFALAEFGDFADRIEIKEHDFAKRPKEGPDKAQALFIKGNWEGDDFEELDELLVLFPEKTDSDDGESEPNPKHEFIKGAIAQHRASLRVRKNKQEKKSGGGETTD